MKTDSIGCLNTLATSKANFRDGLYLFFSRNTMVSLLTPTKEANLSWVMPSRALNSLILFFIELTSGFIIP